MKELRYTPVAEPAKMEFEKLRDSYKSSLKRAKHARNSLVAASLAIGIGSCSAYHANVQDLFIPDMPAEYERFVEQERSLFWNTPQRISDRAGYKKESIDGRLDELTTTLSNRYNGTGNFYYGGVSSDIDSTLSAKQDSIRGSIKTKLGEYDIVFTQIKEELRPQFESLKSLT